MLAGRNGEQAGHERSAPSPPHSSTHRRRAYGLARDPRYSLSQFLYVANRALNRTDIDAKQKTVTSKDGTLVAFEQTGAGPVVILVTGALADRSGTRWLAKHLAEHFTVINYDRRGRGKSTDTQPYAVEREVEDIEALIDATGGSAFVFGVSSGAVLALEAASELGGKVQKLFLYEPPFIVDDSRPPMPADFGNQITEMVSEGHPSDAVKLFFTKGMGNPPFAVTIMRLLMPGWSKMTGTAHTLRYDLAILSGGSRRPTITGQTMGRHYGTDSGSGRRSERGVFSPWRPGPHRDASYRPVPLPRRPQPCRGSYGSQSHC